MIYLDTSYIVKCYLREPGSAEILAWLQGRRGLACCSHGRIEFCVALNRHVREKRLTAAQAARVIKRLSADEEDEIWTWLPVTESLVWRCCDRIGSLKADVLIRAADALHLACAVEHGCRTVHTHDAHMLAAAPHFSVEGVDILAPN